MTIDRWSSIIYLSIHPSILQSLTYLYNWNDIEFNSAHFHCHPLIQTAFISHLNYYRNSLTGFAASALTNSLSLLPIQQPEWPHKNQSHHSSPLTLLGIFCLTGSKSWSPEDFSEAFCGPAPLNLFNFISCSSLHTSSTGHVCPTLGPLHLLFPQPGMLFLLIAT